MYIYRYTVYCQGQPHDGRAAYASVAMLDLHAQRGARAACMVRRLSEVPRQGKCMMASTR